MNRTTKPSACLLSDSSSYSINNLTLAEVFRIYAVVIDYETTLYMLYFQQCLYKNWKEIKHIGRKIQELKPVFEAIERNEEQGISSTEIRILLRLLYNLPEPELFKKCSENLKVYERKNYVLSA